MGVNSDPLSINRLRRAFRRMKQLSHLEQHFRRHVPVGILGTAKNGIEAVYMTLFKLTKINQFNFDQGCNMTTTVFFEDTVVCQSGKDEFYIELGRTSCVGEDSIYLNIDGKGVVMTREIARQFVDAVVETGCYLGLKS